MIAMIAVILRRKVRNPVSIHIHGRRAAAPVADILGLERLFLRALFGTSLELLTKGRLAWGYELKKKEIFCVLFLTTAHFLLINGCKWFLGLDLFKKI